jgi:hypothetical protein
MKICTPSLWSYSSASPQTPFPPIPFFWGPMFPFLPLPGANKTTMTKTTTLTKYLLSIRGSCATVSGNPYKTPWDLTNLILPWGSGAHTKAWSESVPGKWEAWGMILSQPDSDSLIIPVTQRCHQSLNTFNSPPCFPFKVWLAFGSHHPKHWTHIFVFISLPCGLVSFRTILSRPPLSPFYQNSSCWRQTWWSPEESFFSSFSMLADTTSILSKNFLFGKTSLSQIPLLASFAECSSSRHHWWTFQAYVPHQWFLSFFFFFGGVCVYWGLNSGPCDH